MKQEVMAEGSMDREYIQEHAHIWLAPATINLNPKEDVFKKCGDMYLVAGLFAEQKDQWERYSWTQMKYQMLDVMPGKSVKEKSDHFFDAAKMNLTRDAKVFPMDHDLCRFVNLYFNSSERNYGNGYTPIVVTTMAGMKGSAVTLILAEEIKKHIGDFFILPSSVHETIVIPFRMFGAEPEKVLEDEIQHLTQLVKTVNRKEVAPEEWLSDSVMVYYNGVFQKVDEKVK